MSSNLLFNSLGQKLDATVCSHGPQSAIIHKRKVFIFPSLNALCLGLLGLIFCSVTLSGCGGSPVKASTSQGLVLSPGAITFGAVSIGQSVSTPVSVVNQGQSPVVISKLYVTGKYFSLVDGGKLPVTLAPGAALKFNVHFLPTIQGIIGGEVTIVSSLKQAPTTTIGLSGTGKATALSSLSCTKASMTGSGTNTCTVTLKSQAPSGGMNVSLSSNSASVSVPASVMVPAKSTSVGFTATATQVGATQAVTLTASVNNDTTTFGLKLDAVLPTLSTNASSIAFGNVTLNTQSVKSLTLSSVGGASVTISAATLTGAGFTISGASFPLTLGPGQAATLNLQFSPKTAGTANGQLTITSDSSTGAATVVSLSGTGSSNAPSLNAVTCSNSSMAGSGANACSVILSATAPSGGMTVSLYSSTSAVIVPTSVTVPANAASVGFSAKVSSVTSPQTVTLTAYAGSVSKTFALQLNAPTPTLTVSGTSLIFGSVAVNTVSTKALILNSTGTGPVTVSGATLSGAGFSLSGATFPATLNPGQAVTLSVKFNPTAASSATGQLTITSNSSVNPNVVVNLSGTGTATSTPTLTSVSCASASMAGSGTDACTVTLSAATPTGGLSVNLASNNSAVIVPPSVTVPANATSAGFTANVSSVTSAQTATITASIGTANASSISKTFALQLNSSAPTLTVNATSLSFGSVVVNSAVTKFVTLSSTGSAPVTVNAAAVIGSGFSVSGATFPLTLNPSQGVALSVQFDPSATGAVTGQLTITSNSSTNPTAAIALTGTGTSASAAVLSDLSCASASVAGAGSDDCSVTLSAPAPSGGMTVSLSSDNGAVKVPSSLTVSANASTAGFSATLSSVSSAQTATLTASAGSVSKTFDLQLSAVQTASIYVDAQNGSDSNSGVNSSPLKTIQAAIKKANTNNQKSVGTTIIVNPGVYRETVSITGVYQQTSASLVVEAAQTGSAIIAGSDVMSNWTPESGNSSIYSAPWSYKFGTCAIPSGWPTNFAPIALRTEMIFVNDIPLTQVMSHSDLQPGTFFVDESNSTIHAWPPPETDMQTSVVEAAVRNHTLQMSGRSNITLRGLVLRHANTCVNQSGATVGSSTNVLIDQVQVLWNNSGGLGVSTSSNVTVQNSTASYNGGVGFQAWRDQVALFNSNESDYNNWRGAQAAFYDWAMGGFKLFEMRDATVQNHTSYNNQAQGLWFDTDNKNITVDNATLVGSYNAALQIERNEGPITLENSHLCSSGVGVNVLTSEGVTIKNNTFYGNGGTNKGQAQIFVAGQAGGINIPDWQTGQNYDLFTTGMVLSGNSFADATTGQNVFGTYLGGTDWTNFASSLNASNNRWYDPATPASFKIVNGKMVDISGWKSATGTDSSSVWAPPSTSPSTACAVPAPSYADFQVNVDNRSYTMSSGKTVVSIHVNSFGFGPVNLSATGLPSGVSASFDTSNLVSGAAKLTLTASASAATQTVSITLWGTSSGRVHGVTFYVHVAP